MALRQDAWKSLTHGSPYMRQGQGQTPSPPMVKVLPPPVVLWSRGRGLPWSCQGPPPPGLLGSVIFKNVLMSPRPPCGVVKEGTKMLVRWIFGAWMFRIHCILQCFDVPPPPLWCGCGRNQDACAMDLQCMDVENLLYLTML